MQVTTRLIRALAVEIHEGWLETHFYSIWKRWPNRKRASCTAWNWLRHEPPTIIFKSAAIYRPSNQVLFFIVLPPRPYPLPTPNTPATASDQSGPLNPLARISSLLSSLIPPESQNIVLREVSYPIGASSRSRTTSPPCHLPPITSEEGGQYSHWSASPQSETAQEKGTQQRNKVESVRVICRPFTEGRCSNN